jgi:hypothetical protein
MRPSTSPAIPPQRKLTKTVMPTLMITLVITDCRRFLVFASRIKTSIIKPAAKPTHRPIINPGQTPKRQINSTTGGHPCKKSLQVSQIPEIKAPKSFQTSGKKALRAMIAPGMPAIPPATMPKTASSTIPATIVAFLCLFFISIAPPLQRCPTDELTCPRRICKTTVLEKPSNECKKPRYNGAPKARVRCSGCWAATVDPIDRSLSSVSRCRQTQTACYSPSSG